jgi:hypothetical protein
MFENMNLDFNIDDGAVTQESYDAASSSYKDLFDEKFNSFNPETIISGGNGKLKSGMFDIDIEDSDLALGYKNSSPATAPKIGRFFGD